MDETQTLASALRELLDNPDRDGQLHSQINKAHERGPSFTALLMKYIKTRDASVVQMTM